VLDDTGEPYDAKPSVAAHGVDSTTTFFYFGSNIIAFIYRIHSSNIPIAVVPMSLSVISHEYEYVCD
jgi:hypothetical protein